MTRLEPQCAHADSLGTFAVLKLNTEHRRDYRGEPINATVRLCARCTGAIVADVNVHFQSGRR